MASCGYDKKVYIWKETSHNKWEKIFEYTDHKNSVNSVSFCPEEYGLILICGSSDGNVSIHEYKSNIIFILDDNWNTAVLPAHKFGVTSLVWATLHNNPLRFISGGRDGTIKIWSTKENNFGHDIGSFSLDYTLEGHSESINDIIWKYENEQEFIISGGEV